jgi:hypothetical protein
VFERVTVRPKQEWVVTWSTTAGGLAPGQGDSWRSVTKRGVGNRDVGQRGEDIGTTAKCLRLTMLSYLILA